MAKLKIRNAEVLFFDATDNGFGTSITIAVTQEIGEAITAFYAENNIGNEKTGIGVPNFKEYEGTYRFAAKTNAHTKIAGLNGLSASDIGFKARVDLILNTFEYNNKFTKGKTYVGSGATAILVLQGGSTQASNDIADLLAEHEG